MLALRRQGIKVACHHTSWDSGQPECLRTCRFGRSDAQSLLGMPTWLAVAMGLLSRLRRGCSCRETLAESQRSWQTLAHSPCSCREMLAESLCAFALHQWHWIRYLFATGKRKPAPERIASRPLDVETYPTTLWTFSMVLVCRLPR